VRSLKIVLAAAFVILEVGCGLPNPYFLTSPGVGSFPAGLASQCTFTSPGYAAGSNFVGFEVYYKVISSNTPSTSDINLGGSGVTGPYVLLANGFFPITLATDSAPFSRTIPVIQPASTDIPNALTVTLDFQNSDYFYTVGATSTTPIGIGRDLANISPATGSRSFAVGADLGSGVFNTCYNTTHQVWIILYSLSYGLNGTTIEYSTPVYLGFVGLTQFP